MGPYIQVPSAGSYSVPGDPVKPQSLTIASGAAHGRPKPGKWRDPLPGGRVSREEAPASRCLPGGTLSSGAAFRSCVPQATAPQATLWPLSPFTTQCSFNPSESPQTVTVALAHRSAGATGSAPSTLPATALLSTARTPGRPLPSQSQRALQGVGLPPGGVRRPQAGALKSQGCFAVRSPSRRADTFPCDAQATERGFEPRSTSSFMSTVPRTVPRQPVFRGRFQDTWSICAAFCLCVSRSLAWRLV